ncbi:MAG TPA: hydrogenase 2 operon protein HybA [Sulfuricaulis sp.]|nr:hydrogenase 2 operon protein HybA [Sulfuricaulis sp.]
MALNRRDFLKVAAAAGAAGAVDTASALQREPKTLPPNAVGMLYDATQCIGCKACVAACKEANHMPPEHDADKSELMWDVPLDLSGKTLNIIKVYQDGNVAQKDREINGYSFVKRHCLHCVDPSCVSACPVSAMTKDPKTGIVEHHKDRCIGCRYCVYACPFAVPKFEYDGPFGQIQKCQFCAHLQAKGQLPACCDVCPTGASLFGLVEDLKKEAQIRLAKKPGESHRFARGKLGGNRPVQEGTIANYQKHLYGEKELGGTQILYLSAVPFEKIGLPTNVPEYGYPAITEGIQHTLYKGMLPPLALLAGLVYLVHRTAGKPDESEETPRKTKAKKEKS